MDVWKFLKSFLNVFSSQKSGNPRRDSLAGPFELAARLKARTSWNARAGVGRAGEEGIDDLAEKSAHLRAHQGFLRPLGQARQWDWDDASQRKFGFTDRRRRLNSLKFHPQTEKQKQEEQSKLTNLLEKILSAFESSAQTSSRVSEGSDEDDDGKLAKKIDELAEAVKGLRKEIVEVKAGQDDFKVREDGRWMEISWWLEI